MPSRSNASNLITFYRLETAATAGAHMRNSLIRPNRSVMAANPRGLGAEANSDSRNYCGIGQGNSGCSIY